MEQETARRGAVVLKRRASLGDKASRFCTRSKLLLSNRGLGVCGPVEPSEILLREGKIVGIAVSEHKASLLHEASKFALGRSSELVVEELKYVGTSNRVTSSRAGDRS